MHKPRILVTGATGKTGSAVVQQLLARDWPVRALVRSHDARSERLERLGVEVVAVDPFDPTQLTQAMRGTARAYYVPFFHPFMLQSAMAFSVAAREAKLEAIVQMSQWLSSPVHPSLATRQTWLIDQAFATIPGVAHTIINPGYFADNFLRLIDYAATLGIYPILTGKSQSAPVANEDIARVIVASLLDPDCHGGKSYRPTGPKLLSAYDAATVIEKVVGRKVHPVEMPMWMFLRAARLQQVSPFELSGFRYYVEEHRRGAFSLGGGVNDVVREVTGSPAEDFQTTAQRYAALPFARRTFSNRIRVFMEFNHIPFSRGYDLDRYDLDHSFPVPWQAQYVADSEVWRREHATSPINSVPSLLRDEEEDHVEKYGVTRKKLFV